ncbi:MAG: hypothetical protein EOP06_09020 [Proteobacteria bacterium]|nr:MAG: hypothetical protein EOP06_09020 [Pseudomonadota bacterium]
MNLPEVPGDTPVREVYSIPNAARKIGVANTTLYRGIGNNKLKAYTAPNLGTKQPEIVVIMGDVQEYKKTLRPNIRRAGPGDSDSESGEGDISDG